MGVRALLLLLLLPPLGEATMLGLGLEGKPPGAAPPPPGMPPMAAAEEEEEPWNGGRMVAGEDA